MTAEAEVGGEIMDLERASDGFCIAVQGSNEIWAFGPMCSLLYLLTFPEVPDCGAAMPDNSFFLAGCGEIGLVVCALSGEQVHTDGSLQGIQDVALSGDYALLASASDSSFVLLGR